MREQAPRRERSRDEDGRRLNDIGDFLGHVGQAMLRAAEEWWRTGAGAR